MKDQEAKNFYMCEINKDFVIDATFKGNASRFLNHSCAPNCVLEKWQVEGETRVGVFASRSIEVGEPLTYDYSYLELAVFLSRGDKERHKLDIRNTFETPRSYLSTLADSYSLGQKLSVIVELQTVKAISEPKERLSLAQGLKGGLTWGYHGVLKDKGRQRKW
ncbi:UNVERIFIED_CONTAM: Histone-lysine N-methyltransferase ASHR3 [Sesamum radiatum]|uniref:Histone-lysine N-methyltransferase ASHR3 n=1 Tax=Sesamum radiatum TaxID=300843 RepID=A0AAW2NBB5_SESRA